MKKSMSHILLVVLGLFAHGTIFSTINLELRTKEERCRTIHRTLQKKTIFDSCVYYEEFKIRLGCVVEEQHYVYDAALAEIIDSCAQKSDAIYSSLARQAVQDCVEQHGSTQTIIAISGMTLEDDATFFVVPGDNGVFYLNIPAQEIKFLNTFEEKLQSDELMAMILSEEEVARYNLLASLIHSGLRIITEMDETAPHVCAYTVQSVDDIAISYHVKKR